MAAFNIAVPRFDETSVLDLREQQMRQERLLSDLLIGSSRLSPCSRSLHPGA
jgi:hypothetical protein